MRKRFALLWTMAVLGAALALPATTAAGSAMYTYTVQKNTCSSSGGDYGYGHIKLQAKLQEWGWSGANKFTFDAKVQHRDVGSSYWYTEDSWARFVYTFPDDGANYWYSRWYEYDPGEYAWHRIVMKLRVWSNGTVIASRTIKGRYC